MDFILAIKIADRCNLHSVRTAVYTVCDGKTDIFHDE